MGGAAGLILLIRVMVIFPPLMEVPPWIIVLARLLPSWRMFAPGSMVPCCSYCFVVCLFVCLFVFLFVCLFMFP